MAEVKRLNYFTSQFLIDKDFKDEQAYHINMLRTHNQVLHSWGIAQGLNVTKTGDKQVSVSSGVAVDNQGREIVLPSDPMPKPIDLKNFGVGAVVFLTIQYDDKARDETDHYQSGGVDDYTRIIERPILEPRPTVPPNDGSVIVLAKITLDANGNVDPNKIDTSVCRYVSATIAPGAIDGNKLAPNINNTINAAAQFLSQYDLGKRIVTDQITFNQDDKDGTEKPVKIGFAPKLILIGGISKWILSATESYSGLINGFINNQRPPRQQHCFCSGVTKTSGNSWLPITGEGPYLCRVSYQDDTQRKQSELIVDISGISDQGITVKLTTNVTQLNYNPIDSFLINIWLLCLG